MLLSQVSIGAASLLAATLAHCQAAGVSNAQTAQACAAIGSAAPANGNPVEFYPFQTELTRWGFGRAPSECDEFAKALWQAGVIHAATTGTF